MIEEKTLIVRLGQKFRHKETGAIYIVKIIKDRDILLMRENGAASMLIQMESLQISGLEPL